MFRFTLLLLSFAIPLNSIINSGPMVGYSTKSEVALWIQTKESSKVKFIYWDVNESSNIFEFTILNISNIAGSGLFAK